jgi:transcriptional regulator with XRE-family HTH domain
MGTTDEALPPAWRPYFDESGIDSLAELARRIGVHTSTVSGIVNGKTKNPKAHNLDHIREALHMSVDEMTKLLGRRVLKPVEFPREFDLLTPTQQAAIVSVVRSMIDPAEGSGVESPGDQPPALSVVPQAARKRKDTTRRRSGGGSGDRTPSGST